MPTEEIGKLSITIEVDGDKALGVIEAIKKEMEGTRDVEEESTEAIQKNTRKRQTWGKLTLEWLKKVRGYGRTAKSAFDNVSKVVGGNMSMQRLADQMDIPIDKLHEWQMASRRLTADTQNVTKSLQNLAKVKLDFAFDLVPDDGFYRALEGLQIVFEDFIQLSTSDALAKVLSQVQALKGIKPDDELIAFMNALKVDASLFPVAGQFPDTIKSVQPFVITDAEIQAMKDLQENIGLITDAFDSFGRVIAHYGKDTIDYLADLSVATLNFASKGFKKVVENSRSVVEQNKNGANISYPLVLQILGGARPGFDDIEIAKKRKEQHKKTLARLQQELERQKSIDDLYGASFLNRPPSANRLKMEENMRNILKDVPINVSIYGPVLDDALKVKASIGDREMSSYVELNTDPRMK